MLTFDQTVLTPTTGTSAALTAATAVETPPGEYTITLTATGGGKTRDTSVRLTIANNAE
jgi:hypothetical protein